MATTGEIVSGFIATAGAAMGGYYLALVSSCRTGLDHLDGLRWRMVLALFKSGIPTVDHARAMMLIYHNEHTNGNPANDVAEIGEGGPTDPLTVGDLTASGGPSIGPGQVYRSTAIDLGLWPSDGNKARQLSDPDDRQAYADFGNDPNNLGTMIDWSVAVYRSKLKIANGDISDAIKLYNGSEAYRTEAERLDDQLGWGVA